MWLDQNDVARRSARASGKRSTGSVVVHRDAIHQIPVALPEPCTIRSVLSDYLDIKALAKIELPYKTFATESLVTRSGAADRRAEIGEVASRGSADHGIKAEALHTEFPRIE